LTKLLLERLELPVKIEGYGIVSDATGERYEATVDQRQGKVTRDACLVAITNNPFDPNSTVVVAMGSRTFGTAAAAAFLTSAPLRRARRAMGRGAVTWAILDVDEFRDSVARVDLLESGATSLGRRSTKRGIPASVHT
jgi:hypothetical protein